MSNSSSKQRLSIDEIEKLLNRNHGVTIASDGACTVIPYLIDEHLKEVERLGYEVCALQVENSRLSGLINNPHTADFLEAVRLEAAHQRERWGSDHDSGKTDAAWFWLVGYLAGKALHKPEKQLHHIITTAAACLNWHAARTGVDTRMRPGIEEPAT